MLRIAKIFLLLLCAWVLINFGPTLIYALPKENSFFHAALALCSGRAWYWDLLHTNWSWTSLYPYILLARGLILVFALKLWLAKPNLLRASVVIAVGPMVAPTWNFYFGPPFLLFCSGFTVLGGMLIQGWWDNRNRPSPDPSAPMPTWHH